jgi:hypothetical protein
VVSLPITCFRCPAKNALLPESRAIPWRTLPGTRGHVSGYLFLIFSGVVLAERDGKASRLKPSGHGGNTFQGRVTGVERVVGYN